jgi:hypothetical protein
MERETSKSEASLFRMGFYFIIRIKQFIISLRILKKGAR